MNEDECRHSAREAFAKIRNAFPALRFEMDDPSKYEGTDIDVRVPQQDGLKFDVWMNLQNTDELHLAIGERFWVEWFPCNEAEKSEAFVNAVCGVLSGEWRVVEYHRGRKIRSAELQKPMSDRWSVVTGCSEMYIPWPWEEKTCRILQNR